MKTKQGKVTELGQGRRAHKWESQNGFLPRRQLTAEPALLNHNALPLLWSIGRCWEILL